VQVKLERTALQMLRLYNRSNTNKSRASPALQKVHAALIFAILLTEARANSAKPLRLLLRVPLAFLPFG
jgi:hypothetical protein